MGFGLCLVLLPFSAAAADFLQLSASEQRRIADLIYNNECSRKVDCLVSWNDGENFASLGIGHFIWFPAHSKAPFQESFPDLLRWFQAQQVKVPAALSSWLTPDQACPWETKQEFLKAEHQGDIKALRLFLAETQSEQAAFIMHRLSKALPKMLAVGANDREKRQIRKQFHRVSASPSGWYVLADYVNFKGEGTKASERYQGFGWGLTQVLLHMQGEGAGEAAIAEFVASASYILTRRVKYAPAQRNEQRWLVGWRKRLQTYLPLQPER